LENILQNKQLAMQLCRQCLTHIAHEILRGSVVVIPDFTCINPESLKPNSSLSAGRLVQLSLVWVFEPEVL